MSPAATPTRPPPPPLTVAQQCAARAGEARAFAAASIGAMDRATWLDVAACWDVAAALPGNPALRDRALQLGGAAFSRFD